MVKTFDQQKPVYEDPENPGLILPRNLGHGFFSGEYLDEARRNYKYYPTQILELIKFAPMESQGSLGNWDKLPFARMVGYLQNPKLLKQHKTLELILNYSYWDNIVEYVLTQLPTPPQVFELLSTEYENSIKLDGNDSLMYKAGIALAKHPKLSEKDGLKLAESPQKEVLAAITLNGHLSEETRVLAALNLGWRNVH